MTKASGKIYPCGPLRGPLGALPSGSGLMFYSEIIHDSLTFEQCLAGWAEHCEKSMRQMWNQAHPAFGEGGL